MENWKDGKINMVGEGYGIPMNSMKLHLTHSRFMVKKKKKIRVYKRKLNGYHYSY